jgi:apolipoprotein N-acyltransferase
MAMQFLALAAGAACVLAFAPFALPLVNVAMLALLFVMWNVSDAPRRGAGIGFAFGLGLFGAGASWVYIALETFGGMPAPVAVIGTAGFVAILSFWPAFAGWLAVRVAPSPGVARLVASAGAFVLCEWFRGWVFTGFPWLSMGYAEILADGPLPLAGYAPVGRRRSSYRWRWRSALRRPPASCLRSPTRSRGVSSRASALPALVTVAGAALLRVEWTSRRASPLPSRCCRATSRRPTSSIPRSARATTSSTRTSYARARGASS